MGTIRPICLLIFLMASACAEFAGATEPNESFAQSTVLGPGVLTVNDSLTPGNTIFADTVLGILSSFGFITDTNDNGGPYAAGGGSGLSGVPVNNDGTIAFVISGFPDFSFDGSHDQIGDYQVYVDVRDDFGEVVDSYSAFDSLDPNVVNPYTIPDINSTYSYDVYVDNTFGVTVGSDVDFFTFTGLTPGANFSAETMELGFAQIDTFLGWFDNSGNLLATNDDIEPGNLLSQIEGMVPANGKLTFAVTGYGDADFVGTHDQDAEYSLQLTIGGGGDFDSDGDVDGRDFLRWQRGGSPSPFSATDLAAWQAGYGTAPLVSALGFSPPAEAASPVPEPGTLVLIGLAVCGCGVRRMLGR